MLFRQVRQGGGTGCEVCRPQLHLVYVCKNDVFKNSFCSMQCRYLETYLLLFVGLRYVFRAVVRMRVIIDCYSCRWPLLSWGHYAYSTYEIINSSNCLQVWTTEVVFLWESPLCAANATRGQKIVTNERLRCTSFYYWVSNDPCCCMPLFMIEWSLLLRYTVAETHNAFKWAEQTPVSVEISTDI